MRSLLSKRGRYQKRLKRIIKRYSKENNLPFEIIASIIWQESKGHQFAARYEPGFFAHYIEGRGKAIDGYWPPSDRATLPTEQRLRAFSFSVMQVMGQTAREMGFDADDLMELSDLNNNVRIGCKYLAWCIRQNDNDLWKGIARYNGTGERARKYAEKIKSIHERRAWEAMFE